MEEIVRGIIKRREIQKQNLENAFTQWLKVELPKNVDKEQLGRQKENQDTIVLEAKEEASIKKAKNFGISNSDRYYSEIQKDKDQQFDVWELSSDFLRASFQYWAGVGS